MTLALALWGAVLATIVFGWDIMKWRRNAARLRFIVRPDTYYHDSTAVAIPGADTSGGELLPSVHVELANIGTYPTTILNVWWEQKMDAGGTFGSSGSIVAPHFGKTLPYMISVGDVWSCRIDQQSLIRNKWKAPVQIFIAVSHLEKPLVKNVVFKKGEQMGENSPI